MAALKKRRPVLHADAHMLARAKMGDADFEKINKSLKDSINAMDAAVAAATLPPGNGGAPATPQGNTGEPRPRCA